MKRALACAVAVATVAWGASSRANGRFPYANQLVVDPSDPQHVVVRTTYGILQTFDNGASWKWLCEKSVGYGGVFDPAIAVTKTGAILAGIFDGLAVSADKGCSFATVPGALEKQYVIDLVVDRNDPSRALALTSTGLGSEGFHVIVAESRDSGATWAQLGSQLPKDFNSETIEIAPSRPDRIYASGIFGSPRQGALQKSDDRGKIWTRVVIDLKGGKAPYLAAVDPKDPERVFVRIDADSDGTTPSDRLLLSKDGGETFSEIATTLGDMLGFALSPDGSKVAIGGPKDGVLVASTSDWKFAQVAKIGARCLTWTENGLYVCAAEYPDGFTVGVSTDEGKSWKPLYKLAALSPLACPPSTSTGASCPKEWPAVQGTIGQEDAGTGAEPNDAGAPPGAEPTESSCRCSAVHASAGAAPLSLALSIVALRRLRKRARPNR